MLHLGEEWSILWTMIHLENSGTDGPERTGGNLHLRYTFLNAEVEKREEVQGSEKKIQNPHPKIIQKNPEVAYLLKNHSPKSGRLKKYFIKLVGSIFYS